MKIQATVSKIQTHGIHLEIPKNVFKPSFMTREVLRAVSQVGPLPLNSKILDLGTGSGVIALTLFKDGYTNIYASDALQSTIDVASRNFALNNFQPTEIFVSDLFEQIPRTFDLIITNPPAYPHSPGLELNEGMDKAIYSGIDGREFVKEFLCQVKDKLSTNGRFLISAPSFLDWGYMETLLLQNKLMYRVVTSEECILPTYGYPKKKFLENFLSVFSSDYYRDGNRNQDHYWTNFNGEIGFKVRTICGWAL